MRYVSRLQGCCAVAGVLLLLLSSAASAQQLTGGVLGVIRDAQAGVLPGVTVSVAGPALIGGPQVTVTSATGTYSISGLPPGTYELTYELAGFTTHRRDSIRVLVAQNTRVDVDMAVGGVEQAITVSGRSPVVDVTTSVAVTSIGQDMIEAIPTSRNPWVMAALIPGVVAARLDVGGNEAMQQYTLSAYGSSDSQKSFSVDGIKMNWPGGSGGLTATYYSTEMFDEYNMQTASATAEAPVGGVYMNMVTRSGGNRLSGEYNFLFMNEALQGDNVDDRILSRLGLAPGASTAAAGNRIDISRDVSATLGGPIVRDKLWFFGSFRDFVQDLFVIGAVNPDGSLALDDNLARNGLLKGTFQATRSTKVSGLWLPALRQRYHRRDSPYLAIPDKASRNNVLPNDASVISVNQMLGNSAVLDASYGRLWSDWKNLYQTDVGPDDVVVSDVVRFQRFNAHVEDSTSPHGRWQLNTNLSYYAGDLLGGSHEFKTGFQYEEVWNNIITRANKDVRLVLRDGVPSHAELLNTPNHSLNRWSTWSSYVQDRWILGRTTLNVGVRFDGARSWLSPQTSPAGTWVGERSFPKIDVYNFPFDISPRLGLVYDLFGNGDTAIRTYYGRFYDHFGGDIPQTVNPNLTTSVQVPWRPPAGTLTYDGFRYDPSQLDLSNFVGFRPGLFPSFVPDARRPYADEVSAGVRHQLPGEVALSVAYYRRMLRDGLTIVDRARPTSAYTPIQRSYTHEGATQTITVYNLNPALRTVRDRVIANADLMQSTYNGLEISLEKRLSNRWQMLGGATFARHRGFAHNAPFTNTGANTDLNNPNYQMNRDNGAVFVDLPWTVKLAGSYLLPHDILLAGKYNARAGEPLARTLVVSGLNQGTDTIFVQPRGEDRTEAVTNFIDLRVSKRFNWGSWRLEPSLDLYNVLNANPILDQSDAIGTAWGRPRRILAPRVIRLNMFVEF